MNAEVINYTIGIIGLILAVYGIVLAIRSRRIKEPVYTIRGFKIISDFTSLFRFLKITYRNKKIENLTITHFVFYNRGAETITKEDINTANHLRILGKEKVKILDAIIVKETSPSNQFVLEFNREGNQVMINFDYIDKNQGALIQIIHTGLKREDVQLVGDIRGVNRIIEVGKKPVVLDLFMKAMTNNLASKVITIGGIIFIVFLIGLLFHSLFFPEEARLLRDAWRAEGISSFINLLLIVILFLTLYFGIVQYRELVRNYFEPFEIDEVEDEEQTEHPTQ